jgi:hypothetical protein
MQLKMLVLVFVALVLAPATSRAAEELYLVRTLEDPSVESVCPAGDTVRLGALVYAPRTRASDALVVMEAANPIGTAIGCGKLLTYTPFDPEVQSPFAMRFELPSGVVNAKGTCTITNLSFPIAGVPAPLMVVGCTLDVTPDPVQGIVRGIATSSSVFTPRTIPGYGTGSFWTLHLYLAD